MRFQDIEQATTSGSWECNYSMKTLVSFIEDCKDNGMFGEKSAKLQMNPDFQRGHVWTEKQQISFIEAVLQGRAKNAMVIYLNDASTHYRDEYNDAVCVDGLQRYTAMHKFVNNQIKVFGLFYEEFEDYKTFGRKHIMRLNINDLKTKKEVLKWYLELNSNGTPHTEDELNRVEKLLRLESNE